MILGIDPGSRVGLAIIDRQRCVCAQTDIWGGEDYFRSRLNTWVRDIGISIEGIERVVIEQPPAAIFPRSGQSARAMSKIARNVGQLQERTEAIRRACEACGLKVTMCPPRREMTKRKLSAEQWAKMFSWTGKRVPSSHARDAACIAFFG